jgi:CrcB protein
MTGWEPLLIGVGAAVGAPLRYLTDRFVQIRHDSVFPWGTLAVNAIASFVLGVLAGAAVPGPALALVGTGFCGALSTYSTFSFETLRLFERRARALAVLNVGTSVLAGVGAVVVGILVGSVF